MAEEALFAPLGEPPSGWSLRRISSFARKVGSGATPRGGQTSYLSERVNFALIRSQNIYDRRFSAEALAFISDDAALKLKGVHLQAGDVLLNITGDGVTFARAAMVPEEVLPACVNQHVSIIRTYPEVCDPGFLLSYLVHPQVKKYIESFNTGGSRRAVTKGHIESFVVPLPPLPAQRRIASILSAYDDLIENNTKRIEILEEMARLLYREWFVHFRFPGHEKVKLVDSELGKIPEGWEVRRMDDLIRRHIGGGWGKEAPDKKHVVLAPVIRGTDLRDAAGCNVEVFPVRYHTESNVRSRALEVGDVVMEVSGGGKNFGVGRSVRVTRQLLDQVDGPIICASFCKRISPNFDLVSPLYFAERISAEYDRTGYDQYQVQSTGIKNFKFSVFLEKELVPLAPRDMQSTYEELTAPIYNLVDNLGLKNNVLRQTRDLLLPKLLSGEIDVDALDLPEAS